MSVQLDRVVGERLKFGEFELAPVARILWRRGKEIRLGSRAFDILIALASRPGEVVSKDDLRELVWRGTFVDEISLRVGISTVRKALGHGGDWYITTVPGRGYCFVLDVETTPPKLSSEATDRGPLKPQRLPPQIARVVGREVVIDALVQEVARRRLLSLVGPGGIGKTTVALAIAARLRNAFDAIAFVDLAPIEDGNQMSAGVAAALGLNLRLQQDPIEEIAAAVGERRVLLLFDNCEHLVDLAAAFVKDLLGRALGVTILATTRELLRTAGEWVHKLSSLEAPPNSPTLSAEDARGYPAVEMFEDRAAFALGGYQLDDADAPYVADICRRLDGIALAIELAAGRLAGLGVQGLASSLEDCFRVLTHGLRTALPRHQTLRATFDWSYQLLSPKDQAALRRLSVFNGKFTLDAAGFVIGRDQRLTDVGDWLTSLLDKSLVVANPAGRTLRYSLLETTRAYGQEKLTEAGEADLYRQRHAEHTRTAFDKAQAEWDRRPAADWLQTYSDQLGNLRAALDWAFSPSGDAAMGVGLTIASEPLWFGLSLMGECRERVERALTCVQSGAQRDTRQEMQLHAIFAAALYHTNGPCPAVCAAWSDVLAIAELLGDDEYRLRALYGLWLYRIRNSECLVAVALAHRIANLPADQSEPTDRLVGERMLGSSLHFLGDLANARRHLEHVLSRFATPTSPPHVNINRFHFDQTVAARGSLARVLWLQGFPDQAMCMIRDNVEYARALDHLPSLCIALDNSWMVLLEVGDVATTERYVAMLLEHSAKHAADFWHGCAAIDQARRCHRRDTSSALRSRHTSRDGVGLETPVVARPAGRKPGFYWAGGGGASGD
jgi:predicted ATPase/DNA-binding winged helix-turn-helix (wHTH) protein